MNAVLRRLSATLTLLLLVTLLLACGVRPVPKTSNNNSTNGEPIETNGPTPLPIETQPKVPTEKPDAELTVDDFQREFIGKQVDVFEKYRDRHLKITGKMKWFGYSPKGEGYITLEGTEERFRTEEPRPATKVLPGQTVVLRGKFKSMFGAEKYAIVSVTGQGPSLVNADQLQKDLTTNKIASDGKWKDKIVVLTGQIAKVDRGGIVYLTPDTMQPAISCWFYSANNPTVDRERLGQFKAGQKVKILGVYQGGGQLGMGEPVEVLP